MGRTSRVVLPPFALDDVNPGGPGDARARQHKADDGHLLPRAAQHAAGSRAHGRDARRTKRLVRVAPVGNARMQGNFLDLPATRYAVPRIFIQQRYLLWVAFRCGGLTSYPWAPTGWDYARFCIRTSENTPSRHFGELGQEGSLEPTRIQSAMGTMVA